MARADEISAIEAELNKLSKSIPAETMAKYNLKRKEKLFPSSAKCRATVVRSAVWNFPSRKFPNYPTENSSNATVAGEFCLQKNRSEEDGNTVLFFMYKKFRLMKTVRKRSFYVIRNPSPRLGVHQLIRGIYLLVYHL